MYTCKECEAVFCSNKALTSHTKNVHNLSLIDYTIKHMYNGLTPLCLECGDKTKYVRFGKFCSRSCACARRNRTMKLKDCWQRIHGDAWEQRYDAWRAVISKNTSGENNPMYGHHHTEDACERIAKRTRGKTLTEIYGKEQADDIVQKISNSTSGSKNPAYGKVYNKGGKGIKGHYKGFFFRSLFEYSFMKHLENQGLTLGTDVDYECFTIPYMLDGRERTYRIDFYVPSQKIAYEVKPAYILKKLSPLIETKWNAAREYLQQRGIEFRVMTEHNFPKIAFLVARQDLDVVWKEETFKYFRASK